MNIQSSLKWRLTEIRVVVVVVDVVVDVAEQVDVFAVAVIRRGVEVGSVGVRMLQERMVRMRRVRMVRMVRFEGKVTRRRSRRRWRRRVDRRVVDGRRRRNRLTDQQLQRRRHGRVERMTGSGSCGCCGRQRIEVVGGQVEVVQRRLVVMKRMVRIARIGSRRRLVIALQNVVDHELGPSGAVGRVGATCTGRRGRRSRGFHFFRRQFPFVRCGCSRGRCRSGGRRWFHWIGVIAAVSSVPLRYGHFVIQMDRFDQTSVNRHVTARQLAAKNIVTSTVVVTRFAALVTHALAHSARIFSNFPPKTIFLPTKKKFLKVAARRGRGAAKEPNSRTAALQLKRLSVTSRR